MHAEWLESYLVVWSRRLPDCYELRRNAPLDSELCGCMSRLLRSLSQSNALEISNWAITDGLWSSADVAHRYAAHAKWRPRNLVESRDAAKHSARAARDRDRRGCDVLLGHEAVAIAMER